MDRSKLIELHIKNRNGQLTEAEKRQYHQLQFLHPEWNTFLKTSCSDHTVIKELQKSNKVGSLNQVINRTTKRSRLGYVMVASLLFIIMTIPFLFYQTKSEPENLNVSLDYVVHKNRAQILTNDKVYDIGGTKFIDNENYNITIDENKKISYSDVKVSNEYHTIITPYRSQFELVLPDSSIVYMNSNSTLKYPLQFSDTVREVYITGEVFLDVKSSQIPFIVHTGNKDVIVLGTSFNLRNYNDEKFAEVTLVEGSVKIKHENEECVIEPNEQAIINQHIRVSKVDASSYGTWREDVIRFYDVSLVRIVNSLQQLYDVKFVFSSRNLMQKRIFGGIVKANTLQENLLLLEKACDIKFIHQMNQIQIVKNEHP